MRNKALMAIAVTIIGSLLFAGTKVEKEGKAWLAEFNLAPEANINGAWTAKGWGSITLKQPEGQANVTGQGDGWHITGVVSAKKAYLLFAYKNGNVAYSAILEYQGNDTWSGEYFNELLKNKRDKMILVHAGSQSK